MLITKKIHFHMGHRVPAHKSRCKNPHGHTYTVIVGVDDKLILTPGVSDENMVMDFGDIKEIMMREIDDPLDHGFMIYKKDKLYEEHFRKMQEEGMKVIPVDFIPTAEGISKYLFGIIKQRLAERNIFLHYIELWETPTSMARYTSDNWVEDNVTKI